MIGIYKITAPDKKVYIGKSKDIFTRWKSYSNLQCKDQPRIYNSLLEFGVENHKFEIITECDEKDLLDMERYYQILFNCDNKDSGLNGNITRSRKQREEYYEYKSKSKTIKKILAVDEKTLNQVEIIASEMGLNFQQYVYTLLARAIKENAIESVEFRNKIKGIK